MGVRGGRESLIFDTSFADIMSPFVQDDEPPFSGPTVASLVQEEGDARQNVEEVEVEDGGDLSVSDLVVTNVTPPSGDFDVMGQIVKKPLTKKPHSGKPLPPAQAEFEEDPEPGGEGPAEEDEERDDAVGFIENLAEDDSFVDVGMGFTFTEQQVD